MNQAEHIIDLLGGPRKTAELLNAPITTVQTWRKSGFIPARRQTAVLEAAGRAGVTLTMADFFGPAGAVA